MCLEALSILIWCCAIGLAISIPLEADEVRKAKESGGVSVDEGHGSHFSTDKPLNATQLI